MKRFLHVVFFCLPILINGQITLLSPYGGEIINKRAKFINVALKFGPLTEEGERILREENGDLTPEMWRTIIKPEIDRLPVSESFNAIENHFNFERLFWQFCQSRLTLRCSNNNI